MRRKCPTCGRFVRNEPVRQPISDPKRIIYIATSYPITLCSKGHMVELPFCVEDC